MYTDAFSFPGSNIPPAELAWGCAMKFNEQMFKEAAPLFIGMSWQKHSLYSQVGGAMVRCTAVLHMM